MKSDEVDMLSGNWDAEMEFVWYPSAAGENEMR